MLLILSGPLRTAWRRPPLATRGWIALLPMLLSLAFVLSLLTFLTMYAHPFVDTWAAKQGGSDEVRSEIYIMNADGSGQTRLTTNPQTAHFNPAWSPDGTQIAYAAGPAGHLQISLMGPDGSTATQLTESTGDNWAPAWSPDGRSIAFTSGRDGNPEIYLMNADGSGQTRLTNNTAQDSFPTWSPDGHTIAFTSNRDGRRQVYEMRPHGSGQARLTDNKSEDSFPAWAPDGRTIAFMSQRHGQDEIYVMNADGSGSTRLTNDNANDRFPRWSPDGRTITLVSNRDSNWDIYTMNADGSGQTNLTKSPGMEDSGVRSWSPDGRKIAFNAAGHPHVPLYLRHSLGIASILLQAGFLVGLVLLALCRWVLPFGSLTLVFTLNSIFMSFLDDHSQFIPGAVAAGLAADLLLRYLKPSAARPGALHLFAFAMPAVFYGMYFVTLLLTTGIGWSIHLWLGSIVLAGMVGWLLSYVLLPPQAPVAQEAY
jgi:Tol biopolymer transport system component